ncbi:MAG: TetR/AcrR family transcriptional regulator [Microthrixaceae bacterium]
MEEGRDLSTVSVNDICVQADVSASSLYNLYSSKEDLYSDLHALPRAGPRGGDGRVEEIDWSVLDTRGVVREVIARFIGFMGDFEPETMAMMQLRQFSRALTDQHLRNEAAVNAIARDLMAEALGKSGDIEATRRLEFMIHVVVAAITRSSYSHRPIENLLEMDHDEFVDRLTDMVIAYVEFPKVD